ncbi:MAG: galactokinase [Armatimonadetes bacterium]|nr:galactokinase [Armatimonadota bacterium]MDE2205682.1 galactokinase [Armatimonadota bacterium]
MDDAALAELVVEEHRRQFRCSPQLIARAPGRVNLIGEHTDYNDGFVFPAAIERSVMIGASPRDDRTVLAWSAQFQRPTRFNLDTIQHARTHASAWSNYLRAMAALLPDTGIPLCGLNCTIAGSVPLGAGLSSSAAMLVACGLCLSTAAGVPLSGVALALLAQRAEREFVGVNVGIMDQYISALGQRGHALLIDTRSLEFKPAPLPEAGLSIVIADTLKPRGLVKSAYNTRRRECELAVQLLKPVLPGITALRDVSLLQLEQHEQLLPQPVRNRARHVVTEDERTLQAFDALQRGEFELFGSLMNQSHSSLRDWYEVSCPELDALTEAALTIPGVLGSRMTGAGFGGCTVSLVRDESVELFRQEVPRLYHIATGGQTEILVTRAASGACLL